jgi:hypothetical protein
MRPEYKVDLLHGYDDNTIDIMSEWLMSNVGKPYPFDEEATYKRFDWEQDGKWACVMGSNKYNRQVGDALMDTWWFANEKDAMLFSLRWL